MPPRRTADPHPPSLATRSHLRTAREVGDAAASLLR